jgi:hypothetical protein
VYGYFFFFGFEALAAKLIAAFLEGRVLIRQTMKSSPDWARLLRY